MRNFIVITIVLVVVAVFVGCDRRGAETDHALDAACALMQAHPDSSLRLLESVDTSGLDEARTARFALLLTKARDKNYLEPTNDTLIRRAVEHYRGSGGSEEMQSLFYYGQVLFNINSVRDAFVFLHLAYDMAKERNDWYFQGMSACTLGALYGNQYIYDKYLYWAKYNPQNETCDALRTKRAKNKTKRFSVSKRSVPLRCFPEHPFFKKISTRLRREAGRSRLSI